MPVSETPESEQPRPRVLIVDDEPDLIELVGDVICREGCGIVTARNLYEARKVLTTESIELMVMDLHLPDGDGMSLLPTLQKHQPNASAIVITGSPSMGGAISAMRGGALDFVPKPFTNQQLSERIRQALDRQAVVGKREKQLGKLRDAVKRLNQARRVISKKVDLLCNDLVSAYGELSRQLDGVRTQEGFRKYVAEAKDLEQLLCHAMDWLLRQLGYANIGVWLVSEDGEFQLGAYMKYTIPGEAMLTEALKRVLLPIVVRDGFVRMPAEELHEGLTPQEMHFIKDQEIIAVNCTYLGESLAALVFFRDARSPFNDDDVAMLQSVSPIFAVTLASVVRDGDKASGDDSPFLDTGTDDDDKPKGADDWWKRGEAPPF